MWTHFHYKFDDNFSVELDQDMTSLVAKFSEHYHDAWAARKQENGWSYGEAWSDESKTHPRLKPYNMLSDFVSYIILLC